MRQIAPGVIEYGNPSAPVQLVPGVTMFQLRSALLAASKLDAVNTLLAGLSEPLKSRAAVFWQSRQFVRRDDPTLAALANAIGINAAELDALFDAAAAIT